MKPTHYPFNHPAGHTPRYRTPCVSGYSKPDIKGRNRAYLPSKIIKIFACPNLCLQPKANAAESNATSNPIEEKFEKPTRLFSQPWHP